MRLVVYVIAMLDLGTSNLAKSTHKLFNSKMEWSSICSEADVKTVSDDGNNESNSTILDPPGQYPGSFWA